MKLYQRWAMDHYPLLDTKEPVDGKNDNLSIKLIEHMTPIQARHLIEFAVGDYGNIRSRYRGGVQNAVKDYMHNDNQDEQTFVEIMIALMLLSWN